MRMLPALTLTLALAVPALPVSAQDKETECKAQASIVTRTTELRMERKSKKKAVEIMTSGEDPAIAERYLTAVPAIADWIYEDLKRKDLKLDPGKAYFESCMAQ